MTWKVELKSTAVKSFRKLGPPIRARILAALRELESSVDPGRVVNVRALVGELKGDHRLRVGDLRILFTIAPDERRIHVYAILPRGGAYS